MNDAIILRPGRPTDRDWVREVLRERWGSPRIVSRERLHAADSLPCLIAERAGERVGLLTYRLEPPGCEIVSLDSLPLRQGIGTALLAEVRRVACEAGCRRLWLITTPDNERAQAFYRARGLKQVAVHKDGLTRGRALKPELPLFGEDGKPLADEVEFAEDLL
jgi:ribosomal protein S18 acetylase RimI-like enzyme